MKGLAEEHYFIPVSSLLNGGFIYSVLISFIKKVYALTCWGRGEGQYEIGCSAAPPNLVFLMTSLISLIFFNHLDQHVLDTV